MARASSTPSDDPTMGGALPDPDDDSPRGRFNRGEITAVELGALLFGHELAASKTTKRAAD
jgi:hypothetical protein